MNATTSVLKTIDQALIDAVVAECTPLEQPIPSVAQQVNETGLHPIANGRTTRARHAAPWRAAFAYLDAKDALDGVQPTGRHVDRTRGCMHLHDDELEAAVWTLGAVTR